MANNVGVVEQKREPDLVLDDLMQVRTTSEWYSCASELLKVATQPDHLVNGMMLGPTFMRAEFAKKIFSCSARDLSPFILITLLQWLPETYEKDSSSRDKFRDYVWERFQRLPLSEIALEQLALAVPGMALEAQKKIRALKAA